VNSRSLARMPGVDKQQDHGDRSALVSKTWMLRSPFSFFVLFLALPVVA